MQTQLVVNGQTVRVRMANKRGDIKVQDKDFRGPRAQEKMERWLERAEESGNLIEIVAYAPIYH